MTSSGDNSGLSSSRSSQNSDSTPTFPRIGSLDYVPNAPRTSTVIPSPLNPSSPDKRDSFSSLKRKSIVTRFPSEEARALGNSSTSRRNSMILYHLVDFQSNDDSPLPSPPRIHSKRESINSLSEDTVVSLSSDSKYPSGSLGASERGLIAYAYDPALDEEEEDEDWKDVPLTAEREKLSKRGILNVGGLMTLFMIAIGLFVILPIVDQQNHHKDWLISHNPRINSTGQAEEGLDFSLKRRNEAPAFDWIDPSTPENVRKVMVTRAKNSEELYDLVFSREGGLSCDTAALRDLDPSPHHLVETRYPDGFRSFWHNGIWEHVRNDGLDVSLFVRPPGRLLSTRRYVEFAVDSLCQGGSHIDYIRIYRIS